MLFRAGSELLVVGHQRIELPCLGETYRRGEVDCVECADGGGRGRRGLVVRTLGLFGFGVHSRFAALPGRVFCFKVAGVPVRFPCRHDR